MNVVDSSGWLEYFANGPNAGFFAAVVEDASELVVPAISIYEVFKRVAQQRGEDDALAAAAAMGQGLQVDLDRTLAISAAVISLELGLPMADSIILATAYAYNAALWTQDSHLKDVRGVRYVERR
ncbi:MAG: type II toxin-antitoxin system VapC family toxin [Anaerolineae bacterium]